MNAQTINANRELQAQAQTIHASITIADLLAQRARHDQVMVDSFTYLGIKNLSARHAEWVTVDPAGKPIIVDASYARIYRNLPVIATSGDQALLFLLG
ncbi:MAG: hypothetical protein ABI835_20355 [Chloroflexota bacterium]